MFPHETKHLSQALCPNWDAIELGLMIHVVSGLHFSNDDDWGSRQIYVHVQYMKLLVGHPVDEFVRYQFYTSGTDTNFTQVVQKHPAHKIHHTDLQHTRTSQVLVACVSPGKNKMVVGLGLWSTQRYGLLQNL